MSGKHNNKYEWSVPEGIFGSSFLFLHLLNKEEEERETRNKEEERRERNRRGQQRGRG